MTSAPIHDDGHHAPQACMIMTKLAGRLLELATVDSAMTLLVQEAVALTESAEGVVGMRDHHGEWRVVDWSDPTAAVSSSWRLQAARVQEWLSRYAAAATTATEEPTLAQYLCTGACSPTRQLLAIPVIEQGETTVFLVLTRDGSAYQREELAFATCLASMVAVAIQRLRIEQRWQQSIRQLQRVADDSIQAISKIVQIRDPYTAGHEHRVCQLACAIAAEMGLPPQQIAGIRTAALLHDVGKVYVPAEILAKPGRLTPAEVLIIRTHAVTGYEILSMIDFGWPVADIVLQHHERLDGSGYPHGLTAAEICLEAKIIAVADVVESLSSHRPYRPAFRLDDALHEVWRNLDILYDRTVVKACLRVIGQRNFSFDDPYEDEPPHSLLSTLL